MSSSPFPARKVRNVIRLHVDRLRRTLSSSSLRGEEGHQSSPPSAPPSFFARLSVRKSAEKLATINFGSSDQAGPQLKVSIPEGMRESALTIDCPSLEPTDFAEPCVTARLHSTIPPFAARFEFEESVQAVASSSSSSHDTPSDIHNAQNELVGCIFARLGYPSYTPDLSEGRQTPSSSSSLVPTPFSTPFLERMLPKYSLGFYESGEAPKTPLTPPPKCQKRPLFSARATPPKRVLRRNGPIPRFVSPPLISAPLDRPPTPESPYHMPVSNYPPARFLDYGSSEGSGSVLSFDSDFTGEYETRASTPSSPTPSDLDPFYYQASLSDQQQKIDSLTRAPLLPSLPILARTPRSRASSMASSVRALDNGDTLASPLCGLGISS